MRVNLRVLGWTTIAALLLVPASTFAAESREPAKTAYLRYCASCHGASGKGDGPVAATMTSKPTDLTQLAKQNKGEFPSGRLVQVIDGRLSIRAHGSPEMPVWGVVLKAEDGATIATEAKARGQLMLIVEYLGSIQQK